ncbi:unnamed protein product [Zymoseptoria tritici ST99CH_1E4]|uniref:SNF2 N-terminal domain-containing protein n=1 Tax=Zymoseptoria tritici ST99CH_1E4 TaxID=1276532 RepID=A0A2H1G4K2_ZYMTR|nr:unnamed protein product [Zymoseptoria tritici ST99CH_1E4]
MEFEELKYKGRPVDEWDETECWEVMGVIPPARRPAERDMEAALKKLSIETGSSHELDALVIQLCMIKDLPTEPPQIVIDGLQRTQNIINFPGNEDTIDLHEKQAWCLRMQKAALFALLRSIQGKKFPLPTPPAAKMKPKTQLLRPVADLQAPVNQFQRIGQVKTNEPESAYTWQAKLTQECVLVVKRRYREGEEVEAADDGGDGLDRDILMEYNGTMRVSQESCQIPLRIYRRTASAHQSRMTAADVDYAAIEEKVKREFSLQREQEVYFSIPGFDPTACNERSFAALIRQYVYMPDACRPYFHLFISTHDGEMRPSLMKHRTSAVNERQDSVLADVLSSTSAVVEDDVMMKPQSQTGIASKEVEEEERALTTPQAEAAEVEEDVYLDDEGDLSSPQTEDDDSEYSSDDKEADAEKSPGTFTAITVVDAEAEAEAAAAAKEDDDRFEEAGEDEDLAWVKKYNCQWVLKQSKEAREEPKRDVMYHEGLCREFGRMDIGMNMDQRHYREVVLEEPDFPSQPSEVNKKYCKDQDDEPEPDHGNMDQDGNTATKADETGKSRDPGAHLGKFGKEVMQEVADVISRHHEEYQGVSILEHAAEFWNVPRRLLENSRLQVPFRWLCEGKRLKSFQLVGILTMLIKGCGPEHGVILADEMGFGKTIETWVAVVVRNFITKAFQAVQEEWDSDMPDNERKHLHPDCAEEGDKCPLQQAGHLHGQYWDENIFFPCPCERWSVTRRLLKSMPGGALIRPPASLVPVWVSEWSAFIDMEKADMYLRVACKETGPWTKSEDIRMQDLTKVDLKWLQLNDDGSIPDDSSAYVTVVSPDDIRKHIVKNLGGGYHTSDNRQRLKVRLFWGWFSQDEFHLEFNEGKGFLTLIEAVMDDQDYQIVFISGTPMDKNIMAPVEPIRLMQSAFASHQPPVRKVTGLAWNEVEQRWQQEGNGWVDERLVKTTVQPRKPRDLPKPDPYDKFTWKRHAKPDRRRKLHDQDPERTEKRAPAIQDEAETEEFNAEQTDSRTERKVIEARRQRLLLDQLRAEDEDRRMAEVLGHWWTEFKSLAVAMNKVLLNKVDPHHNKVNKEIMERNDLGRRMFRGVAQTYLLRRTWRTRWWDGKRCVRMPRQRAWDVVFTLPGDQVERLKNLSDSQRREIEANIQAKVAKQEEENKTSARRGLKLKDPIDVEDEKRKEEERLLNVPTDNLQRIASTLPGVFARKDDFERGKGRSWKLRDITADAINAKMSSEQGSEPGKWDDKDFIKFCRLLVEGDKGKGITGGPKVNWMRDMMLRLRKMKKAGLFFSFHITVAAVVYVYMKHVKLMENCALIHANMDLGVRTAYMARFQQTDLKTSKETMAKGIPDKIDYLFSTYLLMGAGYTLTRANYTVLMDPATAEQDEIQAAARAHRLNQMRDVCFVFRLVATNSPIEEKILSFQDARAERSNEMVEGVKKGVT